MTSTSKALIEETVGAPVANRRTVPNAGERKEVLSASEFSLGAVPVTGVRAPRTAWIITDGKAGDELPCLGLVERLGLSFELKRLRPRAPRRWVSRWTLSDPRAWVGARDSLFPPPFPDLAIGSGRAAIPVLGHLKRASRGRLFTVYLKDPRVGARAADVVWVARHDRLRGDNVVVTVTTPHRFTPERILAARTAAPLLAGAWAPRVAVLIGGQSRHHRFGPVEIARLRDALTALARTGAGLTISVSRRTPPSIVEDVKRLYAAFPGQIATIRPGEPPDGYVRCLAQADAVVVSADSTNMIGEAAAFGRPIHVFHPAGGHRKIDVFLAALGEAGIARSWPRIDPNGDTDVTLDLTPSPSLDATPTVATEIIRRWVAKRRV